MEYVGDICYDDKLELNRKYIVYGCGVNGKIVMDYLINNGLSNSVVGFCDGYYDKDELNGIKVYRPEKAVKIKDCDFLVSGKYEYEMVTYLINKGINKIHLLSMKSQRRESI